MFGEESDSFCSRLRTGITAVRVVSEELAFSLFSGAISCSGGRASEDVHTPRDCVCTAPRPALEPRASRPVLSRPPACSRLSCTRHATSSYLQPPRRGDARDFVHCNTVLLSRRSRGKNFSCWKPCPHLFFVVVITVPSTVVNKALKISYIGGP